MTFDDVYFYGFTNENEGGAAFYVRDSISTNLKRKFSFLNSNIDSIMGNNEISPYSVFYMADGEIIL